MKLVKTQFTKSGKVIKTDIANIKESMNNEQKVKSIHSEAACIKLKDEYIVVAFTSCRSSPIGRGKTAEQAWAEAANRVDQIGG